MNNIFKNKISNIYDYLLNKLPFRLMYKQIWIDSHHKIWVPRFGWSKNQIKNAEKLAEELNSINWK